MTDQGWMGRAKSSGLMKTVQAALNGAGAGRFDALGPSEAAMMRFCTGLDELPSIGFGRPASTHVPAKLKAKRKASRRGRPSRKRA